MVEIAADAVHFDHLRDIARDQAVEESLLLQDLVVGQGAFVGHLQGASDIGLDGRLVGREGEKEFVEAPHMLAGLYGTVLCEVLRERHHQRAPVVQYVDLLPLPFGEGVGQPDRRHGYDGADSDEDESVHAQLPKRCFDVR